jgi:hypothetical protein
VVRFLPGLAERYQRIVGEAERALLVDVERARESLRGFIGDVRMIPPVRSTANSSPRRASMASR